MVTVARPESLHRDCRRWRADERGAAVFIVVMVITLLTAIGVFAARSASLVDMATGYDRQAVQTRLVTDYAGRLTVSELGTGSAKVYLDQYNSGTDTCASNMNAQPIETNAPIKCKIFTNADLSTLIHRYDSSQSLFVAQSATSPGSFGPELTAGNSGVEGIVRVEIIEAFAGEPAPGSATGKDFRDVHFTVTAYAQMRNTVAGSGDAWCTTKENATGASVQGLRAHITVPYVER
jgi:hypothetical protein